MTRIWYGIIYQFLTVELLNLWGFFSVHFFKCFNIPEAYVEWTNYFLVGRGYCFFFMWMLAEIHVSIK